MRVLSAVLESLRSWWNFLWCERLGFYRPPVVLPDPEPIPNGADPDRDARRAQSERMRRLTRMFLDYEMNTLRTDRDR